LGGVAYGAVASGPPDADVVVLVHQVGLTLGHCGCACVPPEAGNRAILGGVVLQAVVHGGHLALAGELRRLYLPLPGGGGGACVDVDVDLVALLGGGHEHVLPAVVAADDWRRSVARVKHLKRVSFTFASLSAVDQSQNRAYREGVGQNQGVEVNPDFANVAA